MRNDNFNTFQVENTDWYKKVFGCHPSSQKAVRNFRFLEEAVELVQSLGMTKAQCYEIVDYVMARPVGEPHQEVGGTTVTLSALCEANDINWQKAAWDEFNRCMDPVIMAKIQAKQKLKPNPDAVLPADVPPTPDREGTLAYKSAVDGKWVMAAPGSYMFSTVTMAATHCYLKGAWELFLSEDDRPTVEYQMLDLLEGNGASEDHEAVREFFTKGGLSEEAAKKLDAALSLYRHVPADIKAQYGL